jgi:hypothetical protein
MGANITSLLQQEVQKWLSGFLKVQRNYPREDLMQRMIARFSLFADVTT